MVLQTEMGNTQALKSLLAEARAEADALKIQLRMCEQALLSSRLIMGHELKRPTTAISGYLDLALEEIAVENSDEAARAIEKAKYECRLLDELNGFFLELVKLGGKHHGAAGRPLDVRACAEEAVSRLCERPGTRDRVRIRVSPEAARSTVDENALKVVLSNIVENALIYSDEGTPVTVSIEKTRDNTEVTAGRLLRIRVTDQGVGIPGEAVGRIFSPFVRLNGRPAPGAGLGLTLVRSLVELQGGSVYVRSAEGQGTTVSITIPEVEAQNGGVIVS